MTTLRAPRGWKKRVKRVLLNVISLGRVCTSVLEAEDAAVCHDILDFRDEFSRFWWCAAIGADDDRAGRSRPMKSPVHSEVPHLSSPTIDHHDESRTCRA